MSFVQSKRNGSSTGVITITFDAQPANGSLVTVVIPREIVGVASVVDTAGNTYRQAIQVEYAANDMSVYYSQNINSSTPFTVTVTLSTPKFCNVAIHEYSGMVVSGLPGSDDGGNIVAGSNSNTGSGTSPSSGSVTPSGGPAAYTYLAVVAMQTSATTIAAPSAGFAQREEDETFNFVPMQTSDIVSSSAARSTSWTIGTSQAWIALIVAFKELFVPVPTLDYVEILEVTS